MARKLTGKPVGRPSMYTKIIADEFLAKLETGMSIVAICKEDGMPRRETIYEWLAKKPDFKALYEKAKGDGVERLMDELLEIVDDQENNTKEDVARARLRMDARKWVICKLAPKKYGNKLTVENDGTLTIVNALQI
jgi:hypothetical protein